MKLYKVLDLDINRKNIVSVVGGGGKTTTINTLASEFKELDKKVLVATSTGIFYPGKSQYDNVFIKELPLEFQPSKGSITYFGEINNGIKLKTENIGLIDEIIERNLFDIILIESDGSKTFPIKAPAIHEPVISNNTNITIGLIGMDSIGVKIDEEHVHRPELLKEIVQKDYVDSEAIVKLVKHKAGLFKCSKGEKILLLNKADNEEKISAAREIKENLYSEDIRVIIGDIKTEYFI